MSEDASKRLHEGHGRIVEFLIEWRAVVERYLKLKARILLQYALESDPRPAKEINKQLEKEFRPGYSPKTKVKNALNEGLRRFCADYGINPPIQMYFLPPELKKQIMHLGCYRLQEAGKSRRCLDLSELDDMLKGARQRLAEKVEKKRWNKVGVVGGFVQPAVGRVDEMNLSMVFDDITQNLMTTKGQEVTPDTTYYLGTSADWRHIKAGQDVIRKDLMAEIFGHFYRKNICIIRSESGQGKSTLMYRFAFDYQEIFHILEIKHFDSSLVRPVELALQRLADVSKKHVLVLADDVTALPKWELFLNRVKRDKRVYVLATSRSDEWDLSKIKGLEGSVEFVEPKLEWKTAAEIYQNLEERGLVKVKEENWDTALSASHGKLLEFVTILTQGAYLKEILTVQVSKMSEDVAEVLRVISTADTFGIEVDFLLLEKTLDIPPSRIAYCLKYLEGGFVSKKIYGVVHPDGVIDEYASSYEGLHCVRSRHLMEILHKDYPLARTVTKIISASPVWPAIEFFSCLAASDSHSHIASAISS